MGRPSIYTKELSDAICERLASGESLRSICGSEDMPDKATVMRWLLSDSKELSEFRDQYAQARKIQYELMADELLDIADDSANDYMLRRRGEDAEEVVNPEAIGRSRLRVDTRKWFMSKVLPKFADKQDSSPTAPSSERITYRVVR